MPQNLTDLINFFQVDDNLATAGQPSHDQLALVKNAGYQLVINLATTGSTSYLADEAEVVGRLGMDYVHIPVAWESPQLADLTAFFNVMEKSCRKKIFIHCAFNLRVSVFLYLYRVLKLRQSREETRTDLLRFWTPDKTWQAFIDRALQTVYDLICIGNYTKDTITTPVSSQVVDGGAMNYAAHAAAAMGLKTAVVTRLSQEDRHVIDNLEKMGVDCYPTYTPHSTCLTLAYPTANPDIRTLTVASDAGTFTPDQVDGLEAKAMVVGASFRGEVEPGFIRYVRSHKSGRLAVDAQGFLRVVVDGLLKPAPWKEMREVLGCIDIFKVDAVEAEALTGLADIKRAALKLAEFGPGEIVLTHRDGLLVFAEKEFYQYPWLATRLDGRSGRGDTCLGSYTARRLSQAPREAAAWAAALTSLKMEISGPFKRPIGEVEALIREHFSALTQG
jgi:sugar/nucleoside kinase (ribokinase family)/protein tyrosine phosphatase (PTP) superfamily phosphohydrolase (DUF442 family)